MATGVPALGTGATITFDSSFFGAAKNQITSVSLSGWTRPSIKVSHFSTTVADEFIPGDLYDPGSLQVDFMLAAATAIPWSAIETVVLTFGVSSPTTWTWTTSGNNRGGFLTDYNADLPLEDVTTGSATLKLSGVVTLG